MSGRAGGRGAWWTFDSVKRRVYRPVLAAGAQGAVHADLVAATGLTAQQVSQELFQLRTAGFVTKQGGCWWVVDCTCKVVPHAADVQAAPAAAVASASASALHVHAEPAPAAKPADPADAAVAPAVRAEPTAQFDFSVDGRFSIAWAGCCVTLPSSVTRDMVRHFQRWFGADLMGEEDEPVGGVA